MNDDTLSSALDLGTITSNVSAVSVRGDVDSVSDLQDYYQVRFDASANARINLTGLTNNVNLQVLDANGTVLASGSNSGDALENVTFNASANTTYYLRVLAVSGSSNYDLVVSRWPDKDDFLTNAANLGTLSVSTPVLQTSGAIGSANDIQDYFKFTLTSSSAVSLVLDGLSNNANLELVDSKGRVLASSTNGGTAAENITSGLLSAGTYYVRVYPQGTSYSPYNLAVSLPVPPSNPPLATDDEVVTSGERITFDVLANDSDPDGDELTTRLVNGVSHGTLVTNNKGIFQYVPTVGYEGVDSFVYEVSDGNWLRTATVTITVNPSPAQPSDRLDVIVSTTLSASSLLGYEAIDVCVGVVLRVSGDLNLALSEINLRTNAKFIVSETLTVEADSVTLASGAEIVARAGVFDVTNLMIASTASLNADGQGYNWADPGPGAGQAFGYDPKIYNGASHGGLGGRSNLGPVREAYGSEFHPTTWGSSGGFLSEGGGAWKIVVAETLWLDGRVTANGTSGTGSGGGGAAGGSVWIDAGQILGSGWVEAIGGNGGYFGGGGGGGRIAVYSEELSAWTGMLSNSVSGGISYQYTGEDYPYQLQPGGSGTLRIISDHPPLATDDEVVTSGERITFDVLANDSDPDGDELTTRLVNGVSHGTLVTNNKGIFQYVPTVGYEGVDSFVYEVSDGNWLRTATVTITVNPGPAQPSDRLEIVANTILSFSELSQYSSLIIDDLAVLEVVGGGDLSLMSLTLGNQSKISFNSAVILSIAEVDLGKNSQWTSSASITLTVPHLRMESNSVLTSNQYLTITSTDVSIEQGAQLTARTGRLESTNLYVAQGANLNANGLGYNSTDRGPSPGISSENIYSGGSHGGLGVTGTESGSIYPNGVMYGSERFPITWGSAGGHNGSNGGGAWQISVDDTFELQGTITANGKSSTLSGASSGGAGGSIWVEANRLIGDGRLEAKGGGNSLGPGGGGRIAVYYQDNTGWTGMASNSVAGGPTYDGQSAGAGTLRYFAMTHTIELKASNSYLFQPVEITSPSDDEIGGDWVQALRIESLPAEGVLEQNIDGQWISVCVGDILSTNELGNLRYIPNPYVFGMQIDEFYVSFFDGVTWSGQVRFSADIDATIDPIGGLDSSLFELSTQYVSKDIDALAIGGFIYDGQLLPDSASVELITGLGDTDNQLVTIVGHSILKSSDWTASEKSQLNIRVRVTDETGDYFEKVIFLSLVDDIVTLPEDVLSGESFYSVGELATDLNTFTILSLTGPNGENANQLFSIETSSNDLIVNDAFSVVKGEYLLTVSAGSTNDAQLEREFSVIIRVAQAPTSYWTVGNLTDLIGSLSSQIQSTIDRIDSERITREQQTQIRQQEIDNAYSDAISGTHTDFDETIETAADALDGEIIIIVDRRNQDENYVDQETQDTIDQAESDFDSTSDDLEGEYDAATTAAEDEYESDSEEIVFEFDDAKNDAEDTYENEIDAIGGAFDSAIFQSQAILDSRLSEISTAYNETVNQAQSILNTALNDLQASYDATVSAAVNARDAIIAGLSTSYSVSAVDNDPVYLAAVASANSALLDAIDAAASGYTTSVNFFISIYNSTIANAEQVRTDGIAAADAAYDSAVGSAEATYTTAINSAQSTFDSAVSTAQTTYDTEAARITSKYQTETQNAASQHQSKLSAAQTAYEAGLALANSTFESVIRTNFQPESGPGQYTQDLLNLTATFLKAALDAAYAKKTALEDAPLERQETISNASSARNIKKLNLSDDYDEAIEELKNQLQQARLDAEGQLRHPDKEPGFIEQYKINGELTWESYRNASKDLAETNFPVFQALGSKFIELTKQSGVLYEQLVSDHWDAEIEYVEAYANAHKDELIKVAGAKKDYDVAVASAAQSYFDQLSETEAKYIKLLNDAVASREKLIATTKQEFVKSVSSADEEFHKKMAAEGKTRADDFAKAEKAYVDSYATAFKAYQEATSSANSVRAIAITTADTTWVREVSSIETAYTSTTTQAASTLEVLSAQAYTSAQQSINAAVVAQSIYLSNIWRAQFNAFYNNDADAIAFSSAWATFDSTVVSAWTSAIDSLNSSVDAYIATAVGAASAHDNNLAQAYEAHADRVASAMQEANTSAANAAKKYDDSYAQAAVKAANQEAEAWATKIETQAAAAKTYVDQLVSEAKKVVDQTVDAQNEQVQALAESLLQSIKDLVDGQKQYVKRFYSSLATRTIEQANNSYETVQQLATEHAKITIANFKAKKEAAVLEAKKEAKSYLLSAMAHRDGVLYSEYSYNAGLVVEHLRSYVIRPFGEEAHVWWWAGFDPIALWGYPGDSFVSFSHHNSTVSLGYEVNEAEDSIFGWSIPGYTDPTDGPNDSYTNDFNRFVGDYIIRNLIDDERLAQPGGLGDDLLLVGRVITEGTSFIDPTGASDLVNAATYAIGGEWGQVTIAMAGVVAPFGIEKLVKWGSRVPTGVVANGIDKLDEAGGLVNQGAGRLDDLSELVDEAAETVSQRYSSKYQPLGVLQDGCFVAGTSVLLTSIPETFTDNSYSPGPTLFGDDSAAFPVAVMDMGTALQLPIESVPLGARVPTKNPRQWEVDTQFGEPDETWKKVTLTLSKPNGSTTWMEFLRPASWVARHVIDDGLQLSIPELELKGRAEVHSIEQCTKLSCGCGSLVTGRYITYGNSELTAVTLATGATIFGTSVHPVWSATRQEWVPLGKMKEGEELLGSDGPVCVIAVQSYGDVRPVYNLEIHAEHVYQIADSGVIVHNGTPVTCSQITNRLDVAEDHLSIRPTGQLVQRPDRHHIFPQEERKWFEDRGFDIDRLTIELDDGTHSALHTMGWNRKIMERLTDAEIQNGQALNPQQIWKQGYGFMRSQGLREVKFLPYID